MKEKFYKYLDEYLYYLTNIKKYSSLTIKTYQTPIKEAISVSEIYEEDGKIYFDLTKYRMKIVSQKNKTINKKLSSIRSFVEYLQSKNIIIKLKSAQSTKTPTTLPKPIAKSDILETVELSDDIEAQLIIIFIYSFGLRISELASLKLTDIDEDWITVMGKGSKQRQIPSNQKVNKLLNQYIKQYIPKIYLFEKDNQPLTKRQLQYRIKKSFNKLGLEATPHQLRHSFATDLLNNGARILDISELLGHNSLKATGIYTKLNTNTKLKQYNMAHPLINIGEDSV